MNLSFPYRFRVLIFLFFLTLITYLDRICISLVGVKIKSDFHLTNEQFGWALAAFALAYAIFEIPSGVLGDKIGQRAVLIRIVLWWSVFTALTGLTIGLITLIIVRFLFGVGESGAYPNSSAVVSRWFPAVETSRAMSALFVGQNAGAAIAPLIIIPISIAFGWRVPFFVIASLGLIWVLFCVFWFRNNPSELNKISLGEIALIERNRRLSDHSGEFSWKMIFKSKSLLGFVFSVFCSQWAQYFFVAWMPVYLQEGRKFSADNMKLITFFFFIIGMISVLLAGFVSDWFVRKRGLKFTRRYLWVISILVMALSFLLVASSRQNAFVICFLYLAQVFYSFLPITYFATCVDVGGNRVGTIAGIANFSGQVGAFFLAIVFGKVADVTRSFNAPLYIVAGVLCLGAISWFWVDPSKPIFGNTVDA